MHSRLFQLREQSGLFYGISGSLVAQATEQPGMVLVKTKVSLDRLQEAEKAIKETLANVAEVVTPEEFTEAKDAILNSLMLNFESNASIAAAFLFIDRYNFASDFFDKRVQDLSLVTIADMQTAVKKAINVDKLAVLELGVLEQQLLNNRII